METDKVFNWQFVFDSLISLKLIGEVRVQLQTKNYIRFVPIMLEVKNDNCNVSCSKIVLFKPEYLHYMVNGLYFYYP